MKRLIIILAIIFATLPAVAQHFVATPVEISKEKVNISGNYFYVHKVLQGQTLYSLSKAYNVSIEEIQKNNSTTTAGLKAGSIIYIPIKGEKIILATSSSATSAKELAAERKAQEMAKNSQYKKYTVKWFETIQDIANKFKVSVEAIAALNNIDPTTKFKKRQVLMIPDKNYVIKKDIVIVEPQPKDEVVVDTTVVPTLKAVKFDTHRTYKISLVLPFGAALSTDNVSTNMIDFYSGVLLGMENLKKERGLNYYHLNVVDLTAYSSVEEMLLSGILDNSELIIGPILSKDLAIVAEYAEKMMIPLISPMDPKAGMLCQDNPFFFQFPTSFSLTQNRLIDNMIDTQPSDSTDFSIIFELGSKESPLVTSAIEQLQSKGVAFDTLSYNILQGREIDSTMRIVLDSLHQNRVFVASESEAFVNDVLRNLYLLKTRDTFEVSVYGQPKWKNFEIIELEYYHLLDLHLCLHYMIDYNLPHVKQFVSNYWEIFKAEPSPYSFQGYDITTFFIEALTEFGREFPLYLPGYQKEALQSSIKMEPIEPGSGYENTGTRNIVYIDHWGISNW